MPDRHIRLTLPDPVAVTAQREHAPGVWMSHLDAKTSVMMQVPEVGAFVRALLPVQLASGDTVTYGVWLSVAPDDLQTMAAIWDGPDYMGVVIDGVLANAVPPWGLLATPVRAVVKNRRHTPYCDSSPHPELARVLDQTWPDADVVAALDQLA
jgi:hypothetical protein